MKIAVYEYYTNELQKEKDGPFHENVGRGTVWAFGESVWAAYSVSFLDKHICTYFDPYMYKFTSQKSQYK